MGLSCALFVRFCRGRASLPAQLSAVALVTSRRAVHERPFFELPRDPARGEAYEVARDALLQLNIMTRRGIEPDVLMYTSLINIMGRAGLEWQAYKLFSRMVEGNVRPLPETYVALRDATARHRTRLRDEIQTKIEESISTFPEELAASELDRQKEEDRQCVAKFEDYMRGELPPPLFPPPSENDRDTATLPAQAKETVSPQEGSVPTEVATDASVASGPVMTMRIRNPTDAWTTAQHAEEIRGRPERMARGDAASILRTALAKMHEEELRIYLTSNRQMRHGDKEVLINRILETVSEHAIRAMLDRRFHYFRSVEQILASDLEVARNVASQSQASTTSQSNHHASEKDRTMSARESEVTAPEVLRTPWGLIRKPLKYREDRSMAAYGGTSSESMARLEKVHLTAPELFLIRHKAETDELDELPESLLRRYAYQFRLHWRRRDPLSLLNAVSWHATTFLVPNAKEAGEGMSPGTLEGSEALAVPPPTPAIRLQKEEEGMQKTLENYEAFRVISQRTNNLQVVDDKEINLHLKRVRRDALQRERKTEESLRRESNMLAAAGLAASAKSYTPPSDDEWSDPEASHVLGWGGNEPDASPLPGGDGTGADDGDSKHLPGEEKSGRSGRHDDSASTKDVPDELPPWELAAGEEEFNLSTGRFGDPDVGHYQELSDSSIRVLPSRAAQKQWSVDRHLLPGDLKDVVERVELERLQYHDSVEEEYGRRRQYAKYRKWDDMIQRAAKKKEKAERAGGTERQMRPLPAKKRLAQLLRRSTEQQKVSLVMKEKFNKSL